MKAYKGFRENLTCTMGNGTYQFEIGKWHKEKKAQCCSTGFHCTDNPLDVLCYYNNDNDRYFIVEAAGDIHEDDVNSRIACTELRLVKEITRTQLIIAGLIFMKEHPKRKNSTVVKKDKGYADGNNVIVRGKKTKTAGVNGSVSYLAKEESYISDNYVIVRGKHPKAAGAKGSILYLVKEDADGSIEELGVYEVDGKVIKPDKYYNVRGERVYEKKRPGKAKNS